MRRVVTLIYCTAPDCRAKTHTLVSQQFRTKQGWTTEYDQGDIVDYCPEHSAGRVRPQSQD